MQKSDQTKDNHMILINATLNIYACICRRENYAKVSDFELIFANGYENASIPIYRKRVKVPQYVSCII